MGSARLASIHELYLSDAPQIESAWRQWSDDDLKALVPPGRSLSHVKQQFIEFRKEFRTAISF
ncbi:MAG: hypothetical protein Sw1PiTSA_38420 [Shewanella algae]|nr:hypothetical protein AYI82_12920 [Shewanella algae]